MGHKPMSQGAAGLEEGPRPQELPCPFSATQRQKLVGYGSCGRDELSMLPHIRDAALMRFLGGVREGDCVPQHHCSLLHTGEDNPDSGCR